MTYHVRGVMGSQARSAERVDVGKEVFEGVDCEKRLAACVRLDVDDDFVQVRGTARVI